jgi:hypothetical protein
MIKIINIVNKTQVYSKVDGSPAIAVELVYGHTNEKNLVQSFCKKRTFNIGDKAVFISVNTGISYSSLTSHLLRKKRGLHYNFKEIKNKNFNLKDSLGEDVHNDGVFLNYDMCKNFLISEYPSLSVNDNMIIEYLEKGFIENPLDYVPQKRKFKLFSFFKKSFQ